MKTGISTACFYKKAVNEQALIEIGRLGVHRAEMFFSGLSEYKKSYVDELVRIQNGEGMDIASVHALPTQFEPQLFSGQHRQQQEAVYIFESVLEAAQRLGAGVYVFHGPVHLKIARKLNLDMRFVGKRTSELAELAKKYGVKLCYENVHYCWFSQPEFATDLIPHLHTDNLYFTLDMKQAAQSGHSAQSYMEPMGERLAHVHVCDYTVDPVAGVIPCLPFEGEADWEGIRQKLQEMDFDGNLMLEVYASNYSSYQQLKECYDHVQRFFQEELSAQKGVSSR